METGNVIISVSRDEAVDKVIEYCKNTEKPQVMPSPSDLRRALGCVIMGTGDNGEKVYFPLIGPSALDTVPAISQVQLLDRLDVIKWFDFYYKDMLAPMYDADKAGYYIFVYKKGICAFISDMGINQYPSIRVLVDSLKGNENKIYADFFKAVADRIAASDEVGKKQLKIDTGEK